MSCLFDSLGYFVKDSSHNIRNKICDYLQDGGALIDGLDTKFVLEMEHPTYINNMRNLNMMGGAIEIQSACNIWNLKIIVMNLRNGENSEIEFLPQNGLHDKTIVLEWTGGHYEPKRA